VVENEQGDLSLGKTFHQPDDQKDDSDNPEQVKRPTRDREKNASDNPNKDKKHGEPKEGIHVPRNRSRRANCVRRFSLGSMGCYLQIWHRCLLPISLAFYHFGKPEAKD